MRTTAVFAILLFKIGTSCPATAVDVHRGGAADANSGRMTQPHIFFVVADDWGYNDVGFHGSEIKTPFIDSLANKGIIFANYYGHSICTPSRSSIMTGRYASHTGMQHSFLLTGTDVNLPAKFKTMADHLNELGYVSHNVGKWHLGFETAAFTPLGRGFKSYFGYLSGGEDYFTHTAGNFLDLHDNDKPAYDFGGDYSTILFANKTIDVVRGHNTSAPLFVYLAFQAVHSPLQAPPQYVAMYDWITDKNRRTLAGMTTCMDDELQRIVTVYKEQGMWENTLMVMVADNGGPPYVANSNWPMRGGKWTMWEGGTHLAAFAVHGGGGIAGGRVFQGLAHHCDWVPTLVFAGGGTRLNDTVLPSPDGVNLWDAMRNASDNVGPRTHVLLNVDQTNQQALNDPNGWSGYAGIVVRSDTLGGHLKLVLGNPGTPNDWCWPNQNTTNDSTESATAENLLGDCSGSPVLENVALPGDDLMSTAASNWSACCAQCSALAGCNAWTWHAVPTGDKLRCWLKHKSAGSAQQPCTPGSAPGSTDQLSSDDSTAPTCVSWSAGSIPPAGSDPMPDPAHLTCHFNGAVPVNTTGAILFDLAQDPREATNLAALRPSDVNTLRALLDQYIASAVVPLNELPAERQTDPAATETAEANKCWMPWH